MYSMQNQILQIVSILQPAEFAFAYCSSQGNKMIKISSPRVKFRLEVLHVTLDTLECPHSKTSSESTILLVFQISFHN